MNWRIEEREAFEVFGIERIFKNDETSKIPAFWGECHHNGKYNKLIDDAGNGRNKDGSENHNCSSSNISNGACVINALCGHIDLCNQTNPTETEENAFPYMLFAVKNIDSKTDGYKIGTIPKATWAVFKAESIDHNNYNCQIPSLFQRAYSEWLPSSGYEKVNGPDMEIYGEHFEEVWIPVVKK